MSFISPLRPIWTTLRVSPSVVSSAGPSKPPLLISRPLRYSAPDQPPVNPLSLRDEAIPISPVQLVLPDSSLSPPQPLRRVLSSYDHTTHTLALVQLDPPVVRLLDIEAERQKERDAAVAAKLRRKTALEDKEIQVSWSSASGDLAHKLALARGILERGDRVELVCAPRAGNRDKIALSRQEEVFDSFASLEDVGVKWKEDEKKAKVWIAYWRPREALRNELRAKVVEGGLQKRQEKEEKKAARRRKEEERARKAVERRSGGLVVEHQL